MRDLILTSLLLISSMVFSQTNKNTENKSYELSAYTGIGAFPFGLSSIPIKSDSYLVDGDPYTSVLIGLDYFNENWKSGFYIESSLGQNFMSSEWIPFWPSQNEEYTNVRIHSFETKATGWNGGIMIGGKTAKNLILVGKFGVGYTKHTYKFAYDPMEGGRVYLEGEEKVFNYQAALQLKYEIFKHGGIQTSIAISNGNPVFQLGVFIKP